MGVWQKEIVSKNGKANKKYHLNKNKLIDNNETAYIIGLLSADGWIDKKGHIGICLQKQDRYMIQKIINYLEWSGKSAIVKPNGKEQVRVVIGDKELSEFCQNRGVIKNKSKLYKVPEIYKYNSMFWRGVIDGDGCIYEGIDRNSDVCSIGIVGTKDITKSFKNYVEHVIGESVKRNETKKAAVYQFTITGNRSIKVMDSIYSDITNGLYIDRKYQKYKIIKEKWYRRDLIPPQVTTNK